MSEAEMDEPSGRQAAVECGRLCFWCVAQACPVGEGGFTVRAIIVLFVASMLAGAAGCSSEATKEAQPMAFVTEELPVMIGGQHAVRLRRAMPGPADQPHFVSVDILPGRSMNIYQVRAHLPGRGDVELFESPSLEEAALRMNGGPEDFNGNQSFLVGGAILLPYVNRIRGKLIESERLIEAKVAGKTLRLPANWSGKKPGAELHAIHGLMLNSPMDAVEHSGAADHAAIKAQLNAGDFGGHWISKTGVAIEMTLRDGAFEFHVTAKNNGEEALPISIGWHPYFSFPSGDRSQARIRIPAAGRAVTNNYDDVFPSGEIQEVAGTPFDFSGVGGAALGDRYLDECFVNPIKNDQGQAVAEVIDPAAKYGLRISSDSPEISAFMVYSPVDRAVVAIEPQFNWIDPYSAVWGGRETGMVNLAPGASVTYSVRLELFQP
jgi:aldose 1-epimerase